MSEQILTLRFLIKVSVGGVGGYVVAVVLGHSDQGKLAAALGAILVAAILLLIPIFETWYQTAKIKAWARSEVAKHRAIQKARVGVDRVKKAAEGEIAGMESKVHSRRAQAISDETVIRMKLLVDLGSETNEVLRDIKDRHWAPALEVLITRLVLLIAAGSRRVVAGWEQEQDVSEPVFATNLLYILVRILAIELLGLCISVPLVVVLLLSVSSFLVTILSITIARWV